MDCIAYLHKDRKSDFGVSFPDFPGCVTAGKSLEEARRKAPEALAFHIAGMVEDREKIPKPSKMDDLAGDPHRENAVAFRHHRLQQNENRARQCHSAREPDRDDRPSSQT